MLPSKSAIRFCTDRITPTMMVYALENSNYLLSTVPKKFSLEGKLFENARSNSNTLFDIFRQIQCSLFTARGLHILRKPQQTIHSLKAEEL